MATNINDLLVIGLAVLLFSVNKSHAAQLKPDKYFIYLKISNYIGTSSLIIQILLFYI